MKPLIITGCGCGCGCCGFCLCSVLWKLLRVDTRLKDVLEVSWCPNRGRRICGASDFISFNGYLHIIFCNLWSQKTRNLVGQSLILVVIQRYSVWITLFIWTRNTPRTEKSICIFFHISQRTRTILLNYHNVENETNFSIKQI